MIKEAIDRILSLGPPNLEKFGNLNYTDKQLTLVSPPLAETVRCSTLQSLAGLFKAKFDELTPQSIFAQIKSPTEVSLTAAKADDYGRRQVWTQATHTPVGCFDFKQWYTPENFLIAAQTGFQRVKIQNDDGSFAKDLDYVLGIAASVTADRAVENADDGIAQRVALRQGVSLKGDAALRGRVNLAPWRTFVEVDQPLSEFLFRAKYTDSGVLLALFEADGGRWKLDAIAQIAAWLNKNLPGVTVIS